MPALLPAAQRGSRGRLLRDAVVQAEGPEGLGILLGCRGANWEPQGLAGSQHWAADYLTLPEAIRATGPHPEFQGAGECKAGVGGAGDYPYAGAGRW